MKLVENLTEEKKEVVRRIWFGALLNLQYPPSNVGFHMSLIKSFDHNSSTVLLPMNNKFDINEDDVEPVFGLPRGNENIVEPATLSYSPEFKNFLTRWREFWCLKEDKGSPSINKMIKRYTNEECTS